MEVGLDEYEQAANLLRIHNTRQARARPASKTPASCFRRARNTRAFRRRARVPQACAAPASRLPPAPGAKPPGCVAP
eukprot:7194195-Prymnesium_polylepis.1